jgi:hypothetical protein
VRITLRRWACVLAVGGAVLMESAGAGAGPVSVGWNAAVPAHSPVSFLPATSKLCCQPDKDSDHLDASVASPEFARGANAALRIFADDSPLAPLFETADKKLAAAAMSFPLNVAAVNSRPQTAVVENLDADDGSGSGRIPRAATIPLPPGARTTLAGLAGLGLTSAIKSMWTTSSTPCRRR